MAESASPFHPDPLYPEPPGAIYSSELDDLCRIAAWAGSENHSPAPLSFTALLIAFLVGGGPVSRWFQKYVHDRKIHVDRIFGAKTVKAESRKLLREKAASGLLPKANPLFSVSAKRMLASAAEFANLRSAHSHSSVVEVHDLMQAYSSKIPSDHRHQIEDWGFDPLDWQQSFERFLRETYPAQDPTKLSETPVEEPRTTKSSKHLPIEKLEDFTLGERISALIKYIQSEHPPQTISSSVLFFAMAWTGRQVSYQNSSCAFLNRWLKQHMDAYERAVEQFWSKKENRNSTGNPPKWLTENAFHLFRTAETIAKQVSNTRKIGLRHLLTSILVYNRAEHEPVIHKRLKEMRVDIAELRSDFLTLLLSIKDQLPNDSLDAWSTILGSPSYQDVKRAYTQPGFDSEDIQGTQAGQLVDLLSVDDDAKAFASLITAKNLVPPLSIGIFADWGSGKSFFIRRIQHWVDTLAQESQKVATDNTEFCGNVVQIEFNAWHYLDADLWASLVTEIFEKLFEFEAGTAGEAAKLKRAELKKQLGQAKGLFEKAQAELTDAEQARNAAEKALKEAISQREKEEETVSQQLDLIAALTANDPEVKQQLDKLGQDLGIPEVLKSYATFEAKINDLRSLSDRLLAIIIPVFNSPGGIKRFGWLLIALIVPGGACWLLTQIPNVHISETTALAMQVATTLGTVSGWLGKNLNDGAKLVSELENTFTSVQQLRKNRIKEATSRERGSLQALIEREEAAKKHFQETQTRVESLQREIDEWEPSRLLSRFIEERSKTVDYQKRLGIVSLVRKDFNRLSSLLEDAQNSTTPESTVMSVQRIVLYIDDLDRCPADRVVEVLQAVHLLLAFRLFVVVVGVDYRWVSRSLSEHYESLLTNDKTASEQGNTGNERMASSLDYLEKIFQVPFWLRRMNPDMCGSFLEGLIRSSVSKRPIGLPQTEPPASNEQTIRPAPTQPVHYGGQAEDKTTPVESNEDSTKAESSPQPQTKAENLSAVNLNPPSLTLDPKEVVFMKQLAPLLTRSPRSAKRFINTYRIIRAGIPSAQLDRMLNLQGDMAELRAIMFLLSILTGNPHIAQLVFKAIQNEKRNRRLTQVIRDVFASEDAGTLKYTSETVQFRGWIEANATKDGQEIRLRDCQTWIPQVGQYAFNSPF